MPDESTDYRSYLYDPMRDDFGIAPDWLAGSPLSGRLPLRTLCLALLLWLLPTCVMAAPGSIRACMENSDSPPWLLMSGEG